jgi:hypothetical protein
MAAIVARLQTSLIYKMLTASKLTMMSAVLPSALTISLMLTNLLAGTK